MVIQTLNTLIIIRRDTTTTIHTNNLLLLLLINTTIITLLSQTFILLFIHSLILLTNNRDSLIVWILSLLRSGYDLLKFLQVTQHLSILRATITLIRISPTLLLSLLLIAGVLLSISNHGGLIEACHWVSSHHPGKVSRLTTLKATE